MSSGSRASDPGGQGQGSSSHMRTKDKPDNWNKNLKWHPQQETGAMSMTLEQSWQEMVGLETQALV